MMKRKVLFSAASVALLGYGGAAMAEETNQLDITQTFLNVQSSINTIVGDGENKDVSQQATNLANAILGEDEEFDDLLQVGIADQAAANSAIAVGGKWKDSEQAATNVLNLINVDHASTIEQLADASQVAVNTLEFGYLIDGLTQTATNVLNLAQVDGADSVYQGAIGTQIAINEIAYGGVPEPEGTEEAPPAGRIRDVAQAAVNVANLINAEDAKIDHIEQYAVVGQAAANQITFGALLTGAWDEESEEYLGQNATNVANLATLDKVNGTVRQDVSGSLQVAVNVAAGVGPASGQIRNFTQAATNVSNLLKVDSIRDQTGVLEVEQVSTLAPQVAINTIEGAGRMDNVQQTATNVSNLVTIE